MDKAAANPTGSGEFDASKIGKALMAESFRFMDKLSGFIPCAESRRMNLRSIT